MMQEQTSDSCTLYSTSVYMIFLGAEISHYHLLWLCMYVYVVVEHMVQADTCLFLFNSYSIPIKFNSYIFYSYLIASY